MNERQKCIELKNVNVSFSTRRSFFRFSHHQALVDVSFDIYQGETLGIIGRNGCGKSTLLKLLAGIYQPDSGTVLSHVKHISLQSLSAGFDKELSGRDNAILSAMLLGHSKRAAINALDEVLEFSELGSAFFEPVKTYSSGMRARLGFSVAILLKADVLLVDEVLGVGDSQFRCKAETTIQQRIESDQTVLFVSHSASQIKRLCQRAVWLEGGTLKAIGDADTIVNQYESYLQVQSKPLKGVA